MIERREGEVDVCRSGTAAPGLSPEEIQRVSIPLSFLGQSGSGPGLTIVKAVADRHGPRLSISSGGE